jgi:hypothetical protein
MRKAVEMPGRGSRGKPPGGFPPLPPPLEIAARFPHSHSHDQSDPILRNQKRKETQLRLDPVPPGSSFDENMLRETRYHPISVREI